MIYSAIVAPPASKKSPAFNLSLEPVRRKQLEFKAEYARKFEEFREEMEQWENNKKANSKPQKPFFPRNYVNDFTIEALVKVLKQNPKGLLLGLDELAAWVKSMDQYRGGKGADREKWLSFWTCSTTLIDRASADEPTTLSRPFVSVTGGIQPDRLKLLTGTHHDGFIDRILFSFPKPIPDKWTENEVSGSIINDYCDLYDELFALESLQEGTHHIIPQALHLSPPAKKGFIMYYNANVKDIETEANPMLKATFKKIEAYMARFSLIIQLCQDPQSQIIDEKSIEAAAVLAEYFKSHARKVYAHVNGAQINDKILRAVAALRSHGEPMTLRECYTKRVANCRNAADAKQLFLELKKQGYGKMVEIKSSSGGRPTIQFHLNGL